MKVVPYFGNVYIDDFIRDTKEIREHGFDSIIHPVPEIDLEYHPENIKELIAATKDQGFACWVDPQNVGNLFGYGNYSNLFARNSGNRMVTATGEAQARICPRSAIFQETMVEWLELVRDADWVMWDEPDISECYCERCSGSVPMVEALAVLTQYASSVGLKNSVCFWGGKIQQRKIEEVAWFMDDVGVSITPEHYLDMDHTQLWTEYLRRLARDRKIQSSMWVPGYSVPKGKEAYIFEALAIAAAQRIDTIATWGFRGCQGWSYARCGDPAAMWDVIGQAFRSFPDLGGQ